MTQASKRDLAKHKILSILEKSPEGLHCNELQTLCKMTVTRNTFWKYLDEMERKDHLITRAPDPQDSRAIVIKATPESAKTALAYLEAIAQIEKVASGKEALKSDFRGLDLDRKDLSKNEKAYLIQTKRIWDLFSIAYNLVCEQDQKYEHWKAGEVYLRIYNVKGGPLDGARGLGGITVAHLEHLQYENSVLTGIYVSAKRNPKLETALEEAIPGIINIMQKVVVDDYLAYAPLWDVPWWKQKAVD